MLPFEMHGTKSRTAHALALAMCMLATACGARSSLHADDDVAAGGGGATTSSSTSSGTSTTSTSTASTGGGGTGGSAGTGGAGGATGACSVLEVVGPPATLANGSSYDQLRPTWALASDDGAKVALLSAWKLTAGPGDAPPIVHHATFEPWLDF